MNICLVIIDCLRADHLGCYGYGLPTSQNIDFIAKKGVLFKNAVSQSNWTYPSLYSMLTGMYPSSIEISWWDQRINDSITVLPELLAGQGYRTGIITSFKALLNPKCFCSHFNEAIQLKIKDNIPKAINGWLSKNDNSFLLLHIGEYVHEPFRADREYVNMFLDNHTDYERVLRSEIVQTLTSSTIASKNIRKLIAKVNTRRMRLTEEQVRYLIAAYDAGIHYVDRVMADIYDMFEKSNKDYLLVITADHGQAFMEHKVIGHGLTLYEELIHVPLILLSNNQNISGSSYREIANPVELIDLFPTVLDFAGVRYNGLIDGTSLMPFINNTLDAEKGCIAEGYPYICFKSGGYKIITKHTRLDNGSEIFNPVAKSWKRRLLTRLIHHMPDKLFCLNEDPGETINMVRKRRDIYNSLKRELNEIAKRFTINSLPATEVGVDEEIEKQLKSLGYI